MGWGHNLSAEKATSSEVICVTSPVHITVAPELEPFLTLVRCPRIPNVSLHYYNPVA